MDRFRLESFSYTKPSMNDCLLIRDKHEGILLFYNIMYRIYLYHFVFYFILFHCKAIEEFSNQTLNYIQIKSIPSILHNRNVYLSIFYRCSSLAKRRITLSIEIDHAFYGEDFTVFRRNWYCQATVDIQTWYVHVQLHPSIAYAADNQWNFYSWPIEIGQLNILMFDDEDQIIQQLQYEVRFFPVHERPPRRWTPLLYQTIDDVCPEEPEMLRIVNYPLVLTGGLYGKHVTFPPFEEYNLRWEKQLTLTRAKFSLVFWIYIQEYCSEESPVVLCGIFQYLTFNMTSLTPGLYINGAGQLVVHMFGYLYDRQGERTRTVASIPTKDWCRVVFTVNENTWNVDMNCLKTWEKHIIAIHESSISYYWTDEIGTFIVGGSGEIPSFRGFIGQMDIYRGIVLKSEHLSTKLSKSIPSFLPRILSESEECLHHLSTFHQCREQLNLFNQRIQQKNTCQALPFQLIKFNPQSLLIRTWKQQSTSIRYRIFRALYRKSIHSINDVAEKLFQLIINRLENDDSTVFCKEILTWSEQAVCYSHPAIHSLLATFYKFGLCGLITNSNRVLELLFNGALSKDRMSLLALGHRHFFGLDDVPQDYDAAYVYYREMADISRSEFYNPKPDEIVMEWIRLTHDELIDALTFDQSDSFYWLREQARRGVISAQNSLASFMYLGGNGMTRNLPLAVEYFRLAADQNDATGLFMSGLVLLKGQGIAKNVTEGIRYLEKAIRYGHYEAQITLGYHAYKTERNYTKAAKYWQDCYDRLQNIFCGYNLGKMWTAGHYPFEYEQDHQQAWSYYSYAAQKGQIDSKIVLADYTALGDHPFVHRNSQLSAMWSRMVADESSAVGSIVRRALKAYRDRRWQTSLIYYLHAAVAGIELGYFNAGFLCHELKVMDNDGTPIDCIEELLQMSLMMRDQNLQNENYDLLTIAEYYQWKRNDSNKTIELYLRLFWSGDPRGLYNLAQMEENDHVVSENVWNIIGVKFEEEIIEHKYQRLQTIYRYCRSLTIPRIFDILTTTIISILSLGLAFFM